MSASNWEVASDLPGRLVELREVLGDTIPGFTARFRRGENQFYKWQKGAQLPPPRVLETTAEAEGWDREIFEEGGRRPKELVNAPVNEEDSDKATREASGPRAHVDGLLEEIGFDAATFPPEAVLHAASVWMAAVLPKGSNEERAQQWLRDVFEAGKRAGGQAGGQIRGTG